jgi:predicted translin family RNA/ssDNA-binding protein
MKEEILKEIDGFFGNVFVYGINDKYILKKIERNEKIVNALILGLNNDYVFENNYKKLSKKDYKKAKKSLKKKQDFMLFDYQVTKKYFDTLVPDSVYKVKNKIIYKGTIDEELDNLIKQYKRYKQKIEIIKTNKEFILIIHKRKVAKFRKTINKTIHFFEKIKRIIEDFLVS